MPRLEDMPMPSAVLELLFRVARRLGFDGGENTLSFEALTLAVAAWEARGGDLPTVGNSDEVAVESRRQAKRAYLRSKAVERRALYQTLSDLLATFARVPDERITVEALARRILQSGVWFDMPPTAKDWFERLVGEWKNQQIEVCGGRQPAVVQAVRLRDELDKPLPLM